MIMLCLLGQTRAFSGKVVTGFPSENATTQKELERFPIQLDRKAPRFTRA
jgi:hypothetical protein